MITLTDAASRKLNEVIRQQVEHGGDVYGLRISASPGCCSGAQYGMSLAKQAEQGDWEGEFSGVKVLVDADSAPLLQGVAVDYVETPQGAGFTISNPNAEPKSGGCGPGCACGS
jgi:iron-sulfur cluster assembly accessory protein